LSISSLFSSSDSSLDEKSDSFAGFGVRALKAPEVSYEITSS